MPSTKMLWFVINANLITQALKAVVLIPLAVKRYRLKFSLYPDHSGIYLCLCRDAPGLFFFFLLYHKREKNVWNPLILFSLLTHTHTRTHLTVLYLVQKIMSTRHNCSSQFYKLNIELSEFLQFYPPWHLWISLQMVTAEFCLYPHLLLNHWLISWERVCAGICVYPVWLHARLFPLFCYERNRKTPGTQTGSFKKIFFPYIYWHYFFTKRSIWYIFMK